ncbi:NUDIX domain-containing protein [Streptomyces polyrhachis]|uniref:NUDIX domain-containing protein n=1 Tax=Streptomyces polyrhachis TaxID=1282885 RepID=A0ABW2GKP0_9ACTN
MFPQQGGKGGVQAVVVYGGRVLMVEREGVWGLPSGGYEPAESASAAAARIAYELTGYLVDGSQALRPEADGDTAVVCQLLTEDPSDGASLTPEQLRWTPYAQAIEGGVPEPVGTYLRGHTPV